MWEAILLISLVGLSVAHHGWEPGYEYEYGLDVRTVTGVHQVGNQFSGAITRGKVVLKADSGRQVTVQVRGGEYSDFNRHLSEGWDTYLSENEVNYVSFKMKKDSFQLHFNSGLVEKMVVDRGTPNWELNFFKGIASQFQVDTQGQNLTYSKFNNVPHGEQNSGTFSIMEESINGEYETLYTISIIPEDRPKILPKKRLQGDGEHYRIVKSRNFSNSDSHVVYRFGMSGHEGWGAGTSTMGNFLTRSSESTIIISGNLSNYLIESTKTTEKVLVAPQIYNSQKGIVAGRMNLTLEGISKAGGTSPPITNPKTVGSLVYEFEHGGSDEDDGDESMESSTGFGDERREEYRCESCREARSLMAGIHREHPKRNQSESGSIGSSEEVLAPLPAFGGSAAGDKAIVQKMVRVAERIGRSLLTPAEIPRNNVLTYFDILTSLAGAASPQQLQQATETLYSTGGKVQTSGEETNEKYWSWQSFRDAVAQAGTGPALMAISSWIKCGKLKWKEAADVIAALPAASRYPTTEYLNYFFELIKSHEVESQQYLNQSAVLSFAELVRRSQVDPRSRRHRYPVHFRPAPAEQYVLYMQQHLETAIAHGDSIKLQVYVRALSTIAHPKIFAVFEPYLEGKYPISKFQRFFMVASLDEMSKIHPNTARSVLYRIYLNHGEAPEIRVAAVMQLMKTNPSAHLLQQMAERTNYDYSKEVNSAVKSAIESAANGEYGANPQLVKNARSSMNFFSAENYGAQYSKNFIRSYIIEESKLQYHLHLSTVQGKDGVFPEAVIYDLERTINGYIHEPLKLSYMSSTTEGLIDFLQQQLLQSHDNFGKGHKKTRQKSSPRYNYEIVKQMMNLEDDDAVQVEGNFFLPIPGGRAFFPFDNSTIRDLPRVFRAINEKLHSGINFQEAKFYNQYRMEVGFPLVTGVPFTYSLNVPSLVYLGVKGNGYFGQSQQAGHPKAGPFPIKAGINGEYRVVLSNLRRGKMGFFAPFTNQRHIAGVEKTTQLYVPLTGNMEVDGGKKYLKATLQPLTDSNNLHSIYQYNTKVYTTYQNISDVKPYIEGGNAQLVHVGSTKTYQNSFGKEYTGHSFQVKIRSEENFHDFASVYNAFQNHKYDLSAYLLYHDMERSIFNNDFDISYDPQNSPTKEMTVTLTYEDQLELKRAEYRKGNGASGTDAKSGDAEGGRASMLEGRIQFGKGGEEHRLIITSSNGLHPEKASYFLSYSSKRPRAQENFEVAASVEIENPRLTLLNYEKALEAKPVTLMKGEITFQGSQDSKIQMKGEMQRTERRKHFVHKQPYATVCVHQMKEGSNIQQPCMTATENANLMDKYVFFFKYQNVPYTVKNLVESAYRTIHQLGYDYNEENFIDINNEKGKIKLGIEFEENLQRFNASIDTESFKTEFREVPVNDWLQTGLVKHPTYNQLDLFARNFFYANNYPTCSLDPNRISTFNNRSNSINLGNCYHVMAMSVPQKSHDRYKYPEEYYFGVRNFAVLAKDYGTRGKKIQLLVGNDVIILEPSETNGVLILANNETLMIPNGEKVSWMNGWNEFEAYNALPSSKVIINIKSHGVQLTYDGQRLQLSISGGYRNRVRGLCGTFNGEYLDDFTTPQKCILQNHGEFAASYVLADDSCQGPAMELHLRSKNVPCYPKETLYANVINEDDGREAKINGIAHQVHLDSCTVYQVKVSEQEGKTCFSLRPQLSCNPDCKEANVIQKKIDFICLPDSTTAKHYSRMVRNGVSPDFSQKKLSHQIMLNIPERCTKK